MPAWDSKLLVRFGAALVIVGALVAQTAFGFGPPDQQQGLQGKKYEWDGRYLKIVNECAAPVEIHLKYRARPCENCEFTWMPSAPDKEGDVSGTIEPGESVVLGPSDKPIVISGFVYWAQSKGGKWLEHMTEKTMIWVVENNGIAISDSNQRPTFTLTLTCK